MTTLANSMQSEEYTQDGPNQSAIAQKEEGTTTTMTGKNRAKKGAGFALVAALMLSLCFLLPAKVGAFTQEIILIPYKDLLIPVRNPLSIVGDEGVRIEQEGLSAVAYPPSVVSTSGKDVFMSYTWIVMQNTGPVEIATTLEPALNLAKYQEYAGQLLAVEVRATDGISSRDLSAEEGIFIPEIAFETVASGIAVSTGGGLGLVAPPYWREINYSVQRYEQEHCALRSGVVALCALPGGCPCKRWDKRTVAAFTQAEIELIEASIGILTQSFLDPDVITCAYDIEANPNNLIIWGDAELGISVEGLEAYDRAVDRAVHKRIVSNTIDQISDEPGLGGAISMWPLYFYPVPPKKGRWGSAGPGFVGVDERFTPSDRNQVPNRLEIGLVKEKMSGGTGIEWASLIAHEMWHQLGQGGHPEDANGNLTQDDFPYAAQKCLQQVALDKLANPGFW